MSDTPPRWVCDKHGDWYGAEGCPSCGRNLDVFAEMVDLPPCPHLVADWVPHNGIVECGACGRKVGDVRVEWGVRLVGGSASWFTDSSMCDQLASWWQEDGESIETAERTIATSAWRSATGEPS